ncbi:methyl-accepting chemotaxis protein [Sphingomonas sp. AOB5]|uniref:methyl-accepting chemotaxis protein n=1 Tax=Sphingomonas sp. AOB5 TaxID=3034017 RepID=UPI0023F71954|nr:methyl-accepting chemotaxis protein [Sphingomonas sp. AOB5]MDF7776955.1 methyl-accepting chemotaxis protein [Sphingomonas sp. AOB5]
MTSESPFTPYRRSGTRLLVALMWVNWLAMIPVGMSQSNDNLFVAMVVGLAALVLPTIGLIQQRTDSTMRIVMGVSAAIFPALLVGLLEGHTWQMDMHMYFFVCMTMLLLLLDWRPIVACTALTALHHLMIFYLVPEWVFPGSGSLARVLLHAVLVGGQAAILIFMTHRLRNLIYRSEHAHEATEAMRAEAVQAQAATQAVLDELRRTQALSDQRLRERQAAEAALADATSERRSAIALDIHGRIGALATELQNAATSLSGQEDALENVSTRLLSEAQALRRASEKSLSNVVSVAESADQLSQSAGEAGGNVRRANTLVGETAITVGALEPRMNVLTREIEGARGILDLVSSIAAQSNLLALNATIEAARAGDAGLGFGVVAHEMKQMAQRTATATIQIAEKLDHIAGAADTFAEAIDVTTQRMDAAGQSTIAISAAVEQQHHALAAIARAAEAVKEDVAETDARSRMIGDAVDENRAIAARASDLARLLDARARALSDSMDRLIDDLRAA